MVPVLTLSRRQNLARGHKKNMLEPNVCKQEDSTKRSALFRITSTQVSMTKIRQRLSSKHQEIAERLSAMLSKSVKDQAQVSEYFIVAAK